MPDDIAFLHTATVHVATFDRLIDELAPGLRVRHVVQAQLLEEAHRNGANSPTLAPRIAAALAEAADGGAKLVVCTCSTIGGAAEAATLLDHLTVLRIDRAMAERAVHIGPRVLIVAALASTIEPTQALLQDCAVGSRVQLQPRTLVAENAWDAFLAGDTRAYLDIIVHAIEGALADTDVVVLAQASMAPAAQQLTHLTVPVLSSPELGVRDAIARIRAAT